ncbi:VOC family protein [Paenibacillus sp. MWE-103]|uniref:VOC family protein n=1 Tax=Paenibacillus artemisiicola TaxID=1172618 RepID=A0ABS3WAM9_9BACL|nr:VOC family protein [Paenibacillus artemisiicola]MBO7745318.1 VOC family protein [Paenibacillus artemisiicola]
MSRTAAIPMLAVDDAGRAIAFYKRAFGAVEISRMTTDDGKIAHAEVKVGEARIMVADEFPGHNQSAASLGGTPVILYVYVGDVDKTVTRAILEGAEVLRQVQDQPHGDRVGKIEDPFGHVWMLATPIGR